MLLPRLEEDFEIQIGVDEAGRGCLSGPVVAAAVLLPFEYSNSVLNDSKKLNAKLREELRKEIIDQAIEYGIGIATQEEIDQVNILQATYLAMHRAIDQIKTKKDILLIDGNRFKPYPDLIHRCIIKGDGKYQSIAAAAILAKTYRDELMQNLHVRYPEYGWNTNKGYGSKSHVAAIEKYGYTPIHRKSFKLKKFSEQLSLSFDL